MPTDPLHHVYGKLVIVRPPVPATCNKAGANYKSEITHAEYSPQKAYDEWLAICDAILACNGDALFLFETEDDVFLDHGDLHVESSGTIRAVDSGRRVGDMEQVMTGRVFTANGPWVTFADNQIRAVFPKMLPHRAKENTYYARLLERIADTCKHELVTRNCPDRWEGMADVAVVGNQVVLTHTVPGHYDHGISRKSGRSSLAGAQFAADWIGVARTSQIYVELVYPHFHGDTVQFCVRGTDGRSYLAQYANGLWGTGSELVAKRIGSSAVLPIDQTDAVEQYAGNSRQIGDGVLVPSGVSTRFSDQLRALGLEIHRVELSELFGKAGGGPACATLYLPDNLDVPIDAPIRYSVGREQARRRRERLPKRLTVDPGYFEGRRRG